MEAGSKARDTSWVCPNDRQLALRAKLKSGWSLKTSCLQATNKPAPLDEKEQTAIVGVIQKAENFDKSEQIRIGELVSRLENMKRHVQGNGSSSCLLCGHRFGVLVTSARVRCRDCKKGVCQKCVLETGAAPATAERTAVCKICAEARELWKKSGAWFFKGLPRYVKPESNGVCSSGGGRQRSLAAGTATLSSARYSWASKVPTSSGMPGRSLSMPAESVTTLPAGGVETDGSVPPRRRRANTTDLCPCTNPSGNSQGDADQEEAVKLSRNSSAEGSEGTTSQSRSSARGDTSATSHSSHGDPRKRCLSSGSATSREDCIDDNSSLSSGADVTNGTSCQQDFLGVIEFSLRLDTSSRSLQCCIHRIVGLRSSESDCSGTVDAYVKIHLVPGGKKCNKLRTRTVAGSLSPEFNETLTYCNVTDAVICGSALRISVLEDAVPADEDRYGHDVVGETLVVLSEVSTMRRQHFSRPLILTPAMLGETEAGQGRGRILLSLKYVTARQSLVVAVVRCADLCAMDSAGTADAFVKVQLVPGGGKHKTAVKWKSLSPEFNEEFAFSCRRTELPRQTLDIRVYDKDISLSNDYIGGVKLSIDSRGERLRHWFDALKYPDTRHDRWHVVSALHPSVAL